ncbi:unnamed protein product, partial [Heterotrigona itama]
YRKGPNKLSFKGLIQPFRDILKLLSKEIFYLNSNKIFDYISIIIIIRTISQIISFEVLVYLIVFVIIMIIEDFSLIKIIIYQDNVNFFILIYPLYFIFILRILIDLNRVPFDLIERESELVSGFNLEYYRR